MRNIQRLILELPDANRVLLFALITFLKRVCDKCNENEMTIDAMASIWGSLLLRSEGETQLLVMESKNVNMIVRILISEVDNLKRKNSSFLQKGTSLPQIPPPVSSSSSLSNLTNNSEDYCGWLSKQGGSIKTWKKRWFILKDYVLFYYKSNSSSVYIHFLLFYREISDI